jgi:hypothetical protein
MVHRVHGNAANLGPSTQPSFPAGFSKGDIFVHPVAELADGGLAGDKHHTHFAGWQFH